jgi:outer membrane protein assembly factor BamB
VAGGRAFVAAVDGHELHALDARTGEELWRSSAGGRIDSPPTVSGASVVFGSADGSVRCLRASDGALRWRFLAAPEDRRLVAFGQVESVWPVHGSVLVRDGSVYFAAGRSSYVDGGIHLYRLDLESGRARAHERVYSRELGTGEQPDEPQPFDMPGALPDVMSCDADTLYMRHLALDPDTFDRRETRPHLYSPAGFLNGDWWHRTYWLFGTHFYSGYIGWYFAGREAPAGRLLVADDSSIYGYGYTPEYYRGSTGRRYHLFAIGRETVAPQKPKDYRRASREYPARGERRFHVRHTWSKRPGVTARAMVLAGKRLFAAGPPAGALRTEEAFEGEEGGRLCVVSAGDGETLKEYALDALPVFDGMAAAQGRLYLSTLDGRLLCLGERRATGDGEGPPGGSPLRPIVGEEAARRE